MLIWFCKKSKQYWAALFIMAGGEHLSTQQNIPMQAGQHAPSGFLPPEIINAHESNWIDRTGRAVYMVCGDDRPLDKSTNYSFDKPNQLNGDGEQVISPTEGGLAIYGQMAGLVKNTLVAGHAAYGDEFSKEVGGFQGLSHLYMSRLANHHGGFAVRPAMHSAVANERKAYYPYFSGNAPTDQEFMQILDISTDEALPRTPLGNGFFPLGESHTGCAYASYVRVASELVASEPDITDLVMNNLEQVQGDAFDEGLAKDVIAGHEAVANNYPETSGRFTREMYVKLGAPIMLLDGGHQHVQKSGLLINMNPREIGKTGTGFYRTDLAAAALTMRLALPEYDLPVQPFMMAVTADAAPVREVLAQSDNLHAPDLRIGIRGGSAAEAEEEIARIEASQV